MAVPGSHGTVPSYGGAGSLDLDDTPRPNPLASTAKSCCRPDDHFDEHDAPGHVEFVHPNDLQLHQRVDTPGVLRCPLDEKSAGGQRLK